MKVEQARSQPQSVGGATTKVGGAKQNFWGALAMCLYVSIIKIIFLV